ncbi:MAG: polysaccharide deacetylase family protein [Pyrinomonadaceae bacterium]
MKFSKLFLFTVILSAALSVSAQRTDRVIAVTIDDLPVVAKNSDLKMRQEITAKLLGHIKKAKIPAIGFVNERKLYVDEERNEAEVELLRSWLKAGLELGNHTYSHMSLHDNSLEDYQANILKGEIITKEIMRDKGKEIRYFRHPYLWTGLDLETKARLGVFLKDHNYKIAPVTIDNSDWIFARAYDAALEKKDKELLKKIGEAFISYLDAKMGYWERQSEKTIGREIKQILLLHANSINADYFDDVVRMLRKRGYRFITLEESLSDEAYQLPDKFIKRAGISWLHRWTLDKGREYVLPNEPRTPEFVMKLAGVDSE